MILVADSGSTKCDWIIISANQTKLETQTIGFNPLFHSSRFIVEHMSKNKDLIQHQSAINSVFFYGAGCSSEARNKIVQSALEDFFPNVKVCQVNHDLLGACIASSGDQAGICCILGTGSNSCVYDGQNVVSNIPALGYVLGDEGSGSYFGKTMLRDWVYQRMPDDLQNAFGSRYALDKETIFDAVYNKINPNVYLASFTRFALENLEHPYFQKMVYNGLADFVEYHIKPYEMYKTLPVHFIGSIAYFALDILKKIAADYEFEIGNIERRPILGMAQYHQNS